jgi:hypothetical protein
MDLFVSLGRSCEAEITPNPAKVPGCLPSGAFPEVHFTVSKGVCGTHDQQTLFPFESLKDCRRIAQFLRLCHDVRVDRTLQQSFRITLSRGIRKSP